MVFVTDLFLDKVEIKGWRPELELLVDYLFYGGVCVCVPRQNGCAYGCQLAVLIPIPSLFPVHLEHISQTQAQGPNLACVVIIFGPQDNFKCLLELASRYIYIIAFTTDTTKPRMLCYFVGTSIKTLKCPLLTFISNLMITVTSGKFNPPSQKILSRVFFMHFFLLLQGKDC